MVVWRMDFTPSFHCKSAELGYTVSILFLLNAMALFGSLFAKPSPKNSDEFLMETLGDAADVDVHVDENGAAIQDEHGQVALDILDLERAIVIVAPIAGIATEEIDVSVAKNILTVSGDRRKPSVYNESKNILVEECFFGSFSRSVILPDGLALNKIRATMENNLLIVEIPKLQFPAKSIKIDKLERGWTN